jgi:hypothetical protein
MLSCVAGMQTINVGRWLREVSLGFDQARLEVDDVVAELVVLGLYGFVVLVQKSIVTDLLLEFLDISFFPLPEGSLWEKGERQQVLNGRNRFCRIETMIAESML